MTTVLVTGGTGLIGSMAVRRLVDDGADVVAYDFAPNPRNIEDVADRVTVVRGDVTDLPQLLRTFRAHDVGRVLHLAALLLPESQANPVRAIQINQLGTATVFDAALAVGVERVCIASTLAVYGFGTRYGGRAVTEEDPPMPSHSYGVTKRGSEVLAEIYRKDFGLSTVAVRPALSYGTGRLTGAVGGFNNAIRTAALTGKVSFNTQGWNHESRVQFIYAKDMAATFVAGVMKDDVPHVIYNAPVVGATSMDEFFAAMREVLPGVEIDELTDSFGDPAWFQPIADGSLARRELFVPEYDLVSGLAETVATFRAHP